MPVRFVLPFCRNWAPACLVLLALQSFSQNVTISPTTLSFGNQAQGSASVAKNVTLKNGQTTAITFTAFSFTLSDYTQTNNCPVSPATLGAGKNCTISVTFKPSALGSRAASLSIADTGKNSPQIVTLSGTGIAPVAVSTSSISFGNEVVGVKSAASKVTLTNNQSVALSITNISTTLPDYSMTTTCLVGGTLAAGKNCSISVFFDPTVAGLRSDTLTISDNATISPTVTLTGTGILSATVNPASLTFGDQALGTSSAVQNVTLTNNQSAAFKITNVTVAPTDFTVKHNCPGSLGAGASCTASITFSPRQIGTRNGTLTFTDKATNSPQIVTLTGAAVAANLISIAVTPANPSIAAGATQQFTATGTYSDGSTQNLTGTAAWTSSLTSVAGITAGGLATGNAAGSASIAATSGSISGSTTLTVKAPSLVSIAITPANSSFALGTTQTLKATGTYTDGSTQDLTNSVTWNTTNPKIASVNAAGVATSVAVGTASATATSGAIVGSTNLTVTQATLVSIAVTPAIPSIPAGTTQQFTATGTFTDGSTQNLTTTVQWSSDTTSVATIGSDPSNQGLAAGVSAGNSNITATSGSISGGTTITVTAAALVSIALTPSNPTIVAGATQQLTATGTFTDGTTQDLTASAVWTSDTNPVATVKKGLITSLTAGTANISAASGSISGSTLVTVTAAQLISIAVNPQAVSVPAGVPQQFTATGTYTDGSTQDVTQTGHWTSSTASVATISNDSASAGLATTITPGNSAIGINLGSVSASASLTVQSAALVSIAISPVSPTIALGTNQQFTATGAYTDSSSQDLTATVNWTSSNANVAVMNSGSNGLATSAATGTTTISATLGSISNSTALTVAGAALLSISVSPANASIPLGTTQPFTATGIYSDGSSHDLTGTATWSSDTPLAATIDSTGIAFGIAMGSANISASSGSTQGSAVLNIGPAVLVSLEVTPNAANVVAGNTQQFTAIGTYSDNSTQNLTPSVNWSSSAPLVATVNGTGLAKGTAQGAANIAASLGSIGASASLTVTAPVLTSIAVSPSSASIANGTTQQFNATGTYSDGSTQDLTTSASWTSSSPDNAPVTSAGLATAKGIGNATITATSGSISGTASLAVGQPTLISIVVTPANSSLALGTALQMKATGTYTDGSTMDLTVTATWTTGDSNIATVDARGSVMSSAMGNTTVTATSGAISGSTSIAITPAALVSIAVTPAIPAISLGTKIQFTATGTFTDSSTQDLTQTVQWNSDTPEVAAIDDANKIGLATSITSGSATITATQGSVSGNTTLTVTAAALVSIAVSPANATVALGTTQQFTAIGTFTDSSTQDVTSSATWASDDSSTATINNAGLVTSMAQGTTDISATSGNISGSTTLIVSEAQLVSIAINPPSAAVAAGTTQQFTATGTFTDSSTHDITATAHWSSTNADVATISNSPGSPGLAATQMAGTTTIGAGSGSISTTATLAVNAAALVSIAISPQNPTISYGTNQQFAATGTYTDGSVQDITSAVTWSSSDATVLVISNATGTSGLANSSGIGTVAVSAASGSISSSTSVTVGQAALVSIAVAPANSSLAQGYALQFAATGTYSDNSTQDLTQSVGWSSSAPTVAGISTTGLANALLAGGAMISATSGSISGSTSLTVTAAVPLSLSIGPMNPAIFINAQQQFTATLLYSDGTTLDVTSSVAWTSFTASLASISSGGLATGLGSGSSIIQASWASGALTATTTLNISAFSVTVIPASMSIAIGGTQQFSASVAGTGNQAVTWSVDGITGGNSSVGLITAAGFYTAPPMIGNHAITATSQVNSASLGTASLTIGSLVPVPKSFFGMHLHFASSAVPGNMEGAGRIWDSNAAQWPNLNPTSGNFVWTALDSVLTSYKNAGINDILYTLWRVPKWASSNPTDTTCDYASLGPNFTGSCDLPNDLNPDGTGTDFTWRNWVQNIAQHVNDPTYLQTHARVSYWETCNECYRSPTLDPGYGTGGGSIAYKGTYSQLVRMMQDARCIIIGVATDPITALGTNCGGAGYPVIGVDPSAQMVMPSTSPTKNGKYTYAQIMQNVLYCACSTNSCSASTTGCTTASAGSAAVDILSAHIYPNNYKPEDIPANVAIVRGTFIGQDLASKPLWSDEGGWGQNTNAIQINNGDPDLEAAWIARFYLMNWASGLGRSYWYEWDNTAYGTLWNPTSISGCTTPFTSGFLCSAGVAYQQTYNWMLGSTLTNCSVVGTSWTCNLIQANGSAAQILWDTSQSCANGVCGTVQYNISSTLNTYKDLTGAVHNVNGTVPVGIKPILLYSQ
jgi:hypothetical protein